MHHLRSQLTQKPGGVSAPLVAALKLQRLMSHSFERGTLAHFCLGLLDDPQFDLPVPSTETVTKFCAQLCSSK